MDLKEMKYSSERKIELLATGHFGEYEYFILNLGWHPTAYVRIPENHPLFGKFMDEVDLDVHGGVTYSDNHLYISESEKIDGWFFGWDYAHYGDYGGYQEIKEIKNIFEKYQYMQKKWKTEEILEHVRQACRELKEHENGDNNKWIVKTDA